MGETPMQHGDLGGQCPRPGSTIEVTNQGAAVFSAARQFYETVLASDLMITPDSIQTWNNPAVGEAVLDLLDACHTLIDC
jgi:hypothetical protein